MRPRRLLVLSLVLGCAAACGGTSSSDNPDANLGGDAGADAAPSACAEFTTPEGSIAAVPGTFSGAVNGHNANLDVAMGICTVEQSGTYFEPKGEDVVVKVSGLTVGTQYGIILNTAEDLSFYVATGCTDASMGPAAGQCALFVDETTGKESGPFTATATEEYIVVDASADPTPPTTGAFDLDVVAAECTDDSGCATSASGPYCVDFTCVQCTTDFDCTSGTPVCGGDHTCEGPLGQCTGDDAHDSGTSDDGPSVATTVTVPTAGKPTVIVAAICDTPFLESDYYKLVWPADGDLGIALDFAGAANDLDVFLLDSTGAVVDGGVNGPGTSEALVSAAVPAGTYYLLVYQAAPAGNTAAVPYTLTLDVPACASDFDCKTAAKPVCSGNGLCQAGPALCTSDDTGDTTSGGDDGPAGARLLTPIVGTPATVNSVVCNSPAAERDLYKVVIANGGSLVGQLAWTGTDDLDLRILDSNGAPYGVSFYEQPETVSLTYLPTGTYYLEVTKFDATGAVSPATTAYTLTASIATPVACVNATSCAASYSTQIYRGNCTAGACHFIAPGTRAKDVACDSGDDCLSRGCSYLPFESNAQRSVCTDACATTADCAAIGAGLTCAISATDGSGECVPSCASDLDCGADVGSSTLDAGQPWDYNACTVASGECALP